MEPRNVQLAVTRDHFPHKGFSALPATTLWDVVERVTNYSAALIPDTSLIPTIHSSDLFGSNAMYLEIEMLVSIYENLQSYKC